MSKTRVVHVRDVEWRDRLNGTYLLQEPADSDVVYIGRYVPRFRSHYGLCPWGNPFIMKGRSNAERARVIAAFRDWVLTSGDYLAVWIREHVHELAGKRLACWCRHEGQESPACHGDVLAELAEAGVEVQS